MRKIPGVQRSDYIHASKENEKCCEKAFDKAQGLDAIHEARINQTACMRSEELLRKITVP